MSALMNDVKLYFRLHYFQFQFKLDFYVSFSRFFNINNTYVHAYLYKYYLNCYNLRISIPLLPFRQLLCTGKTNPVSDKACYIFSGDIIIIT